MSHAANCAGCGEGMFERDYSYRAPFRNGKRGAIVHPHVELHERYTDGDGKPLDPVEVGGKLFHSLECAENEGYFADQILEEVTK